MLGRKAKTAMPQTPVPTNRTKGALIKNHPFLHVVCEECDWSESHETWTTCANVQDHHNRTFHSGGAK